MFSDNRAFLGSPVAIVGGSRQYRGGPQGVTSRRGSCHGRADRAFPSGLAKLGEKMQTAQQ
jgi:hypothetical protein